jgi:hypothetical protein
VSGKACTRLVLGLRYLCVILFFFFFGKKKSYTWVTGGLFLIRPCSESPYSISLSYQLMKMHHRAAKIRSIYIFKIALLGKKKKNEPENIFVIRLFMFLAPTTPKEHLFLGEKNSTKIDVALVFCQRITFSHIVRAQMKGTKF